jgi:hypothetical protein
VKSSSGLVAINGDSTIKYNGTSVTLEHGIVAVSIAKRMDARMGNLLISGEPGAKFQVTNASGIERIAAIEGSLTITDGLRSVTLTAGEMMTHDTSTRQDDAPPLNIGHHLPGWVIEVMIEAGIAAAVIAGLAAAGDFGSRRPVSPSGP